MVFDNKTGSALRMHQPGAYAGIAERKQARDRRENRGFGGRRERDHTRRHGVGHQGREDRNVADQRHKWRSGCTNGNAAIAGRWLRARQHTTTLLHGLIERSGKRAMPRNAAAVARRRTAPFALGRTRPTRQTAPLFAPFSVKMAHDTINRLHGVV